MTRLSRGVRGAASTAHPEATGAAVRMLEAGGSAVDATIAAQAVIAAVMPQAAGLGGDLLALVRAPDGTVHAVNGVGRSPAVPPPAWGTDGGSAVTVPGLVDGWITLHGLGGRLPLATVLDPARRLATGYRVDATLAAAVLAQRPRLSRHGAGSWSLLTTGVGEVWQQPELAELLGRVGVEGRAAVHDGVGARAVAAAARREGGTLTVQDLAEHRTATPTPVRVGWDGGGLLVQPPSSQGVLLAMAAAALDRRAARADVALDHVLVELTGAAFEHRSEVVARGADLLTEELVVDPARASRRSGPRSYLHTAGVAVADADGTVVSSLVSVFDDFGSAVYVPELGIVLNNRAAGFTDGPNAPGPGRYPVHTLAPAMVLPQRGGALALATPGADGQVQTLLQVLAALRYRGDDLGEALRRPRWRSQDGRLLVEAGHPAAGDLGSRGHDTVEHEHGDEVFGAVVAAGLDHRGPYSAADPRRGVRAGAAS